MSNASNAISGFGSVFGDILSGFQGQNNLDWLKNALSTVYGNLTTGAGVGNNILQSIFPQVYNAGVGGLNAFGNNLFDPNYGQVPTLGNNIGSGYSNLSSLFLNNPNISGAQGNIGNLASLIQSLGASGGGTQLNDNLQQAVGLLQNHGQTEGLNNAQTLLGNFAIGNSGPQQSINQLAQALMTNPGNYGQNQYTNALQNFSEGVMGNNGVNPLTAQMQQYGTGLFNNAGQQGNLPQLTSLFSSLTSNPNIGNIPNLTNNANNVLALNAMGTPGQTQAGAAGENAALTGFLGGGNNAASNYLLNRGQQLANINPLLPTNYVYNLARDQAAQQNLQQAKTAQEQAESRSGTTGPVVAAGSGNQDLNAFMDQALSNEATAGQNALVQQQGLGLNQLSQGLGSVGNSQNLANTLLSIYGGNLTNLENSATNRYSVGGNLGLGAQSEANNVLGMGLNTGTTDQSLQNQLMQMGLGQLDTAGQQQLQNLYSGIGAGTQGQQLQLQNTAEGGNLMNAFLNSMLTGTNSILPFQQQQSNNLFNAGNLLNSTTGLQGNLASTAGGLQQALLNSFLSQAGGYQGAYQGLLGSQNSLIGSLIPGYSQSGNMLNQMAGLGSNLYSSSLGDMSHLFSSFDPSYNPMGTALGYGSADLGSTIAGILMGLGV